MSLLGILYYVATTLKLALPMALVVIIFRWIYKYNKGKGKIDCWKKELGLDLLIVYIFCLYQITALRIGLGFSLINLIEGERSINLVPLVQLIRLLVLKEWWLVIYNVVGNCIWFIPLGFLLPLLWKEKQRGWKVVGIGTLISTSIEMLQFILGTGTMDSDDVLLNALGTLMGYGIWQLMKKHPLENGIEQHTKNASS